MPKTMLVVILAVILISLGGTFKTSSAAPLLPPQNLKVPALAFDEKSITLTWEKAADYASIIDYNIYLNGKRIGTANENAGSPAKPYIDQFYADSSNSRAQKISLHNYTVTGLKPSTAYTFTVRAVYRDGRESPDSNRVIQSTTASPRIFNIVDYGAVGDGTTLNTKAIQAAINACTAGGKVLVPAGTFKTGAIWLKSNMTLEIAKDATLLGSENPDDYPYHYLLYSYSTDERFYSLINAQAPDHGSLANIRIIGAGTIDGNGWRQIGVDPQQPELPVYAAAKNSTNKDGSLNPNHVLNIGILAKAQVMKLMDTGLTFKSAYPRRSNLITLRGVNNVYYGGFTAVNPANHTVVNIHCNNVTVAGVMFKTFQCNNGDGIEFIHGNGLTVFNNVFDTGDDCMNFAAGLGAASQKETASQNAWIFNNYFRHGHGAIVAGSHTAAWIEQILGED
ncbi:fibronectin type iii, partial [Lucifera butyrica]